MSCPSPRTTATAFLVLTTALYLCSATATAQGKTQKISKNLISRAEDMVKEVEKTRSQVVKTVDKYNAIFAKKSVKDRQKAYKDLTKEIKKTEDRVKEVRKRIDRMQKDADRFFNEWSKGIMKITDPQLREVSHANMTESRNGYGRTIESGLKAGTLYSGFVTDLKGQVSYLDLDMSDNAMSKLTANQAQMATKITSLYQAADELAKVTNGYIASMK